MLILLPTFHIWKLFSPTFHIRKVKLISGLFCNQMSGPHMYSPGAQHLLMEASLAALTLRPQSGKLLFKGGEVGHLLLVQLRLLALAMTTQGRLCQDTHSSFRSRLSQLGSFISEYTEFLQPPFIPDRYLQWIHSNLGTSSMCPY